MHTRRGGTRRTTRGGSRAARDRRTSLRAMALNNKDGEYHNHKAENTLLEGKQSKQSNISLLDASSIQN